ncbi:hypothetical protein [Grimontia sp. NTOU-MAR1]|uniref:hypothetical protein n=1 Tax=Grimontia sp. NTOU-MAR1 TaxID=3111011 RepID=UPI002DB6415C|nr:hypothetical protein [Grimontia sp. NTOU-MAR1]WRW00091.1 hypothetical protein VP504_24225 [Grimontia sp. NTOU-MAR1]
MTTCSRCQKARAISYTTFEAYCETCSLDVALTLLSAYRLSDKAIAALVTAGWDIPITTVQHYTATDIALELGVSAQKVGKTANAHGIKCEKYGEWRLDQAANSRKQIETFHYNDQGKRTIAKIIRGND